MIFLCDYYNQASKDLAYSLQAAGYDATTVVINPDGFLPQGALSPFTYYVEAGGNWQTTLFQPSSCASLLGNFREQSDGACV